MTRHLSAFALACFAVTGVAVAAELAPINAHSIRLARFDGIVYYTVEQDGYRVVATLASGPEDLPIRFISTLGPGQRAWSSRYRGRLVSRRSTSRSCGTAMRSS